MVAARFHARDQWNEMKKTSNIEHPTPKGSSPARIPELAFCPPAAQPRVASDFTCSIAAGKP